MNLPLAELDVEAARSLLRAQIEEGRATVERERVTVESVELLHFADMQFQGQTHILTVPLASPEITVEELQALFDRAYWERFAVELPEIRAVLVNLHTAVIGTRRGVPLEALAGTDQAERLEDAQIGVRGVWFEQGWQETPVYERGRLPLGARFVGPAVVQQLDATTVIEPGNEVAVDRLGNLLIEVRG
jgi:N-methylhydantoinase A